MYIKHLIFVNAIKFKNIIYQQTIKYKFEKLAVNLPNKRTLQNLTAALLQTIASLMKYNNPF